MPESLPSETQLKRAVKGTAAPNAGAAILADKGTGVHLPGSFLRYIEIYGIDYYQNSELLRAVDREQGVKIKKKNKK